MHCYLWLKGCYYVGENVHNLLIFVNLQVVQESAYTQLEKKKEKKKKPFPLLTMLSRKFLSFFQLLSLLSLWC